MCCLCLLEKKYDFGFGNIDCHYWCAPSNRATACLYAGSADEYGGGPQCVLTFGFEHGMETKVHAQCARRDNSMHAVETPWEHNESACNRQLERRRNAMQLRRNAMVAVRSPWHCHLQEKKTNFQCDLRRSVKISNAVQSQWQRRYVSQGF